MKLFLFTRTLALLLSLGLALPSPALALRPLERQEAGVEELAQALGVKSQPAAGLEEIKVGDRVRLEGEGTGRVVGLELEEDLGRKIIAILFDHAPAEPQRFFLDAIQGRLSPEGASPEEVPVGQRSVPQLLDDLERMLKGRHPHLHQFSEHLAFLIEFLKRMSFDEVKSQGFLDRLVKILVWVNLLPLSEASIDGEGSLDQWAERKLVNLADSWALNLGLEAHQNERAKYLGELRDLIVRALRPRRSRKGIESKFENLREGRAVVVGRFENLSQIEKIQLQFLHLELGVSSFGDSLVLAIGSAWRAPTRFNFFSQNILHTHGLTQWGQFEASDEDTISAESRAKVGKGSFILYFSQLGDAELLEFDPSKQDWKHYTDQAQIAQRLTEAGFLLSPAGLEEEWQERLVAYQKGLSAEINRDPSGPFHVRMDQLGQLRGLYMRTGRRPVGSRERWPALRLLAYDSNGRRLVVLDEVNGTIIQYDSEGELEHVLEPGPRFQLPKEQREELMRPLVKAGGVRRVTFSQGEARTGPNLEILPSNALFELAGGRGSALVHVLPFRWIVDHVRPEPEAGPSTELRTGLEEIPEAKPYLEILTGQVQGDKSKALAELEERVIRPLREEGDPRIESLIPPLSRLLREDPDDLIRRRAGLTLGLIGKGNPQVLEAFRVGLLGDSQQGLQRISDEELRQNLVSELDGFEWRGEELLKAVEDLLENVASQAPPPSGLRWEAESLKEAFVELLSIRTRLLDFGADSSLREEALKNLKEELGSLDHRIDPFIGERLQEADVDLVVKNWTRHRWILEEALQGEPDPKQAFKLLDVLFQWARMQPTAPLREQARDFFLALLDRVEDRFVSGPQIPGRGRFLATLRSLRLSMAGLEEAVWTWTDVATTPAYEGVTKSMLPIFLEGTHHAIPLVAKAGRPFLVLTSTQAGLEQAQALLDRLGVAPTQYQIWVESNVPTALEKAQQTFSDRFHPYPVNPKRPNWLKELLAGLEEHGILPVGDIEPALQAAQDYFQFV